MHLEPSQSHVCRRIAWGLKNSIFVQCSNVNLYCKVDFELSTYKICYVECEQYIDFSMFLTKDLL
jgi:hypothetical protein